MTGTPDALVVFAKYPEPGKVKTRLGSEIGAERAADLYRELLLATIEEASRLAGVDVVVAYTPRTDEEKFEALLGDRCQLLPQHDGDLGERIDAAFRDLLATRKTAVIIGADSPTLPTAYLRDAFTSLSSHDLTLGPTEDGGYYLVGLQHPQPDLFAGIPWSTDQVFDVTRERARELGLRLRILPVWHDIDTVIDLRKALLYDDGALRAMLDKTGLLEVCYSCSSASSQTS
jgi:rSAM/selenodomain-associated transferase 1